MAAAARPRACGSPHLPAPMKRAGAKRRQSSPSPSPPSPPSSSSARAPACSVPSSSSAPAPAGATWRRARAGRGGRRGAARWRCPRRGGVVAGAEAEGAGARGRMTVQEACELLGIEADETDFNLIVDRKNKLLLERRRSQRVLSDLDADGADGGAANDNADVEEAYDVLLMRSLTMRNAGAVSDPSVRYADVRKRSAEGSPAGPKAGGIGNLIDGGGTTAMEGIRDAAGRFPFRVGMIRISGNDSLRRSVAFASILALALLDGVFTSSSMSSELTYYSVPGAQLAFAIALATYFVSTNNTNGSNAFSTRTRLVPAFFVCLAVLLVGCGAGDLVETAVVRVGGAGAMGISNPATVPAAAGIAALWLASLVVY